MTVSLSCEYVEKFIDESKILALEPFVKTAHKMFHDKKGEGAEFTGWMDLPEKTEKISLDEIHKTAQEIKNDSEVFLVIGTGGSYLGARACIEFLYSGNYNFLRSKGEPQILFVGNNLSSNYLNEIFKICENKDICLNIISKSGNTLEPMTIFEIFKNFMENKYGKDAKKRIFCTTSPTQGKLLEISKKEGYKTFFIPEDVGGRFSCLTPVGLLPIAVSGGDIHEIIRGAKSAQKKLDIFDFNDCYRYAVIRNLLYKMGKNIEIFVGYEPRLESFFSWCKQLFGESEGKNHMGIFPTSANFTMDLHSLGQYIQDGSRNIFETVLSVENPFKAAGIWKSNYEKLLKLNKIAETATLKAHVEGDVPNVLLKIDDFSEFTLGYLIYFFEKACAISGYLLGVNPFNQPGVELYKKNMSLMLKNSL